MQLSLSPSHRVVMVYGTHEVELPEVAAPNINYSDPRIRVERLPLDVFAKLNDAGVIV